MDQTPNPPFDEDSELFLVGDLRVFVGQQRVTRSDREVALPNLSFRLLLALVRAAPNVLSNEALMTRVWPGLIVNPETVNKRVELLRNALGDDVREPRYIAGVRSRGYRVVAPTSVVRVSAAPADVLAAASVDMPAAVSSPQANASDAQPPPGTQPHYWRRRAVSALGAALIVSIAFSVWITNREHAARVHNSLHERMPDAAAIGVRARTVAVLPFKNMSADSADAYLAQGVPEMILNRMSEISGLSVIARSSSFALDTTAIDTREIGRRLNSGYLIEGSMQRDSARLRIAVQLVDTTAGTQLWSARFDRDLRDTFAIEDDIAEQVGDALSLRLGGLEPKPITKERGANIEAYLAYLRGRTLLGRFSIRESEAAVPYFERAIALDPHFASAYASLYDARMQAGAGRGEVMAAVRGRYRPLIDRALAIDPQSGVAYFARAMWSDGDVALRNDDFLRGVALDPSNGRGITAYSEFLAEEYGRPVDAALMLKRALWIDPISPRARFRAAVEAGSAQAREQKILEILELDPNFVPALQRYGKYQWLLHGKLAEAIQLEEHALALDPSNPWTRNIAMAIYLDIGDEVAARDVAAGTAQSAATAKLLLSLYRGDWRAAGIAAFDETSFNHSAFENWEAGEALRDYALKTGELEKAIQFMKAKYDLSDDGSNLRLVNFRQGFYLSQLLDAQGNTAQGLKLRRAVAKWNDANQAASGTVYARRLRAGLLLLDGKQDAALAELAESFRSSDYTHWWYTTEYDPLWLPLHADSRFRAIVTEVRRYVDEQRRELEALREHGEVPRRAAAASTL